MNVIRLVFFVVRIFVLNLFRGLRRNKIDIMTYFEENFQVEAGKITTTELVNKIFTFCELYSGIIMYPYQEQFGKRVIRSVLTNDGDEITALFARQSGKSETIATVVGGMIIILPKLANMPMFADDKRLLMFKDGLWVGIFAPSQRQAQITYGRMKSRLQSKTAIVVLQDEDFRLEFSTSNGQTVALTNGSFATAISASEGSSIEGESFKLIIMEECQDISNYKIRKSIQPMGASYNATLVKIGTATTFKGDFYDAIERNKRDYNNGDIPIKNHFEYDYKVVMKYNPKYEKYVRKEMYRLGEDSDEFQMSYCLKWILQRGMFVDLDILEKKNGEPLLNRVFSDTTKVHVAGIDLAGKDDSTVVTIVEVDWDNPVICEEQVNEDTGQLESFKAYNTVIKDWLEINGDDYNNQYFEILDYLKNFKMGRIMVDATKESSVAHRMRANLSYEVIPYIFSTKSKSDMYKCLDREIKSGRAKFPMSPEVVATREYKNFSKQIADLQKNYSGAHMVVSHPPEKGAHDDYCLSLNTEILTTRGFLKYGELLTTDKVAKVENNEITYVTPNNIILKQYTGDMYRFKSKDLNLEVTTNHKMLTRHRKSGREGVLLSQDLASIPKDTLYNTRSIPVAPISTNSDYSISDDMIKQIGWLITEGWVNKCSKYESYRYSFGQSKQKQGYEDICEFIETLDMKPYIYHRKDGVTIWTFHKKDNDLFDNILTEGIHRIPREWLNRLSFRQLNLLYTTLMLGDGTISRNTYHTNSLGLAQDFQELCMKIGIKTSIRKNVDSNGYIMYNCYVMNSDESRITQVEKYHHEGEVWCVNVDNGFIVTRNDNKIAVTGNCDSWALAVLGTSEESDVGRVETQNSNPMYAKTGKSSFYKSRNNLTARRR